jgi:hypothetical protein
MRVVEFTPDEAGFADLLWARKDVDSNQWLGFQELVLGHTR